MRKAMIILADGFEEVEAIGVITILRRAEISVTIVGLVSTVVEGFSGIKIIADRRITEVDPNSFDMLILPGGPAYKKLENSKNVIDIIKRFDQKKKFIAAIGFAPIVLAKAGILEDRIVTVFPGYEKEVPRPREASIIVDRNVITAQGTSTTLLFALKLVEILASKRTAEKIKKQMVIR
ncbi:MAG: DJ-1/PfpI family protein [Candidatus Aenigmarchaeota archaeon]|nr:DJ-1/PfpI family protein [Candidatus Aenigmarchaeota archaeon]